MQRHNTSCHDRFGKKNFQSDKIIVAWVLNIPILSPKFFFLHSVWLIIKLIFFAVKKNELLFFFIIHQTCLKGINISMDSVFFVACLLVGQT